MEQITPGDPGVAQDHEPSSSHNHISPAQNGTDSHVEQLTQQIVHYKDKVKELQYQVQQTRETATRDTRHQVVAEYQVQISSLQQVIQNVKQELADSGVRHQSEVNALLERQEAMKESLNTKHAEHIVRLTEQLSAELNESKVPEDETEREAERMKQLKETMIKVHEQEKEIMSLSHQQEKELLRKENEKERQLIVSQYQAAMEGNKQQLETLANEQIKQMHSQYVTVHTSIEQQKNELEKEVQEYRTKVAVLEETRQQMAEEMRQLHKSHHHEIQEIKHESQDLKSRLHDWRNKASSLETRIHQASVDQSNTKEIEQRVRGEYQAQLSSKQAVVDKLQEQLIEKERAVEAWQRDHQTSLKTQLDKTTENQQAMLSDRQQLMQQKENVIKELEQQLVGKKEKEQSLHNRIKQLEGEREAASKQYEHLLLQESNGMLQMKADHKQALEDMQTLHDATIDEIESKHSSLLEDSISEQTGSRASLEFAEAHMKELQSQLNAYRNQASTHKEAIETLTREHANAMEQLKVTMATREGEREAQLREEHTTNCLKLQQETDQWRHKVDQQQLVIGEMSGRQDSAVVAAVTQCNGRHVQAIEDLTAQHTRDITDMQHDKDTAFAARLATELDTLKQQLVREREEALKQTRDENKMAIEQLKQSLTATGEEALSEARSRVVDLEDTLRQTQYNVKEARQAQEKCQVYETQLRASQVKLSLAQSELDKKTQFVKQLENDVAKWRGTADNAHASLTSALQELDSATERHKTELVSKDHHFQQLLQGKNDEIATHQSHNKVLNTRVTELTQELKQEREAVSSMKKKTEDDTAKVLDQQLIDVQSQLHEAKEKYSNLVNEWRGKEGGLQEKVILTEQLLSQKDLQWSGRLEQVNSELAHERLKCQNQDARIVAMTTDIDTLKADLVGLQVQHQQLLQERGSSEQTLQHEMEQLHTALDQIQSNCQELSTERNELQLRLKEFEVSYWIGCSVIIIDVFTLLGR